ncbi:sugar ABC transporter substrate-binding protein [Limnochorda pilosa]|uniref:Sugar ABC transporter substrate-binding protein n=2 Tax=Limnochorda pilosa TaxID=1555112 RepID=A0A0K2SLD7_LIMPI|nr:sugar ABC transporter substrate-binding protein [Limnochorda pilosa]
MNRDPDVTRRTVLKWAGSGALAVAAAPYVFVPRVRAQGRQTLRIIQWSHFVPAYDVWFDQYAQEWGKQNNVQVTVDHIAFSDLVPRANAEVAAQEGHDLFMFISPPAAFEPHVLDMADVVQEVERRHGPILDLAKRSTYNPVTEKWFGFSDNYVPDPGDYLKSIWSGIGMPDGPKTWEDLLNGGKAIRQKYPQVQIPVGIGLSQDIDSNMASRALLWSYGASVQDENERVVLNSDATLQAVEFMATLYREAMSPAVLSWNASSNNQAFNASQTAYIVNSISAYRTAQDNGLPVADDTFFVEPLKGPTGLQWASEHVMGAYFIWQFAKSPDLAKKFLVDLVDNYRDAVMASKLYNFPSFPGSVAEKGVPLAERQAAGQEWMVQVTGNDPFGSNPPNKLAALKNALQWSTNVGHPGPANPAIGEVFDSFVLPDMFAKVATGALTAKEAVAEAEARVKEIFARWRERGLVA